MALKDLDTFFDPDLYLPIRGKRYRVPAPDFEEAERLREVVTIEGVPPVEQIAEAVKVLGPAFQDMVADNIPWPMILHSGRTAIIHFGFSPDMGEVHWHMAHLARLVDIDEVSTALANKHKMK